MTVAEIEAPAPPEGRPAVRLTGIRKRFGAIVALRGVDLEVWPGEVLGLVGDNGAGKSTLMKILAGAVIPDEGEIVVDGISSRFAGPRDARTAGIEMVYQDLALCDDLNVASNFFLGREPRRFGLERKRRMHEQTRRELERLGVRLPSTKTRVRALSGGQRQAVAIGRSVSFTPKILVMDEPTAALGVRESAHVLELIQRVKAESVAVIMISHRLQDVFAVCDRIAVMYEGAKQADVKTSETTLEGVVNLIVGPTIARYGAS
jgi:simple sugar transport system ATP-binding protein